MTGLIVSGLDEPIQARIEEYRHRRMLGSQKVHNMS
jgi:hypothetical protein